MYSYFESCPLTECRRIRLETELLASQVKSKSKSHCDWRSVSQSVSQSVSKSWCQAPSGAHDQIFITVWQFRSCFCGAPFLTRGRFCILYMLLTLASVVFLGSESLGTRDHILLSLIWDFPFRRLLRLAGSRWRYSTPPPHGFLLRLSNSRMHWLLYLLGGRNRSHHVEQFLYSVEFWRGCLREHSLPRKQMFA
jgi:hypothetical protein